MKFNIGDKVWRAKAGLEAIETICPECLGSARLRVILGDESQVSIPCVCCEHGWDGSLGKIQSYTFVARTEEATITGIELHRQDDVDHVTYSCGGWHVDEEDLFLTQLGALADAARLVTEYEANRKRRLGCKEKQHKTWASNVAYWRSEIRRAKQTIAMAETRINAAPKNVKEVDKNVQP
jgi:hypothetical protein